MTISDKNNQKTKTKAAKGQLIELSVEYRNKMAEEKLKKLTLANSHQEFDLEKKKDSVCYKAVAMKEFEKAVADIYARIKNADEQLTDRLHLNIQQASILHDYMEQLLEDLSNIEIELDSTENFDADNYFAGKARRSQMLATE